MTPTPRQPRPAAPLLLLPCLLLLCLPRLAAPLPAHARDAAAARASTESNNSDATAQASARPAQGGSRKTPARRGDAKERARREREKRLAVAALAEAAADARTFDDKFHGAEIQTIAADALWPHDEQTARVILRRAWETAAASDSAELAEERESGRYGDLPHRFTRARDIVLSVAAGRDTRLADALLKEMSESAGDGGAGPSAEDEAAEGINSIGEGLGMSVAAWQRLQLARTLLAGGEAKRAAEVAAPVIVEGASAGLVSFLLELRAQTPDEADALYLRLLDRARADTRADANDVLLLSSHVVSPNLLTQIDENGSVQFHAVSYAAPDDAAVAGIAPRVRAAFYEAAAAILLRQQVPAGGGKQALARASALYFTTGRLLPFFERDAPQRAPELHARLAALSQEMEAAGRDALSAQMRQGDVRAKNPSDPLRSFLDRLAASRDDAERDALRAMIADTAARRGMWDRAERAADEMTDAELRRRTRARIAVLKIARLADSYPAEAEDDFERAALFVRAADAPALARAYGMAQAAALAARRNRKERAAEFLNEAIAAAEQTQRGTLMRSAAFAAVTAVAARSDAARAWEALSSFVRAANAVEGYAGDEQTFTEADAAVLSHEELESLEAMLTAYPLEDVFAAVAGLDFPRALTEARTLKGEVPRAYALVAAASAALERAAGPGRAAGEKR